MTPTITRGPTRWYPIPGDEVAGIVVSIRQEPDPYRPGTAEVATIAPTDSGPVEVWITTRYLRSWWRRRRPSVGDWVAIRREESAGHSPLSRQRAMCLDDSGAPLRTTMPNCYRAALVRQADHQGYADLCPTADEGDWCGP